MKADVRELFVKICGITSVEDAAAAVEAGADLLGFNFYPASPRYIKPERCQEIIAGLQARGLRAGMVGVFVNAPLEEVQETLEACRLHLAQLSGDEPAGMLYELKGRAYKALRPKDADDLQRALQSYPVRPFPPAFLIDAYRPGEYGGTGQTADWSLVTGLARQMPLLLAGGLTPENVWQAVAQVQPWGVDVASGVESAPGVKDADKMRMFIEEAKLAFQSIGQDKKDRRSSLNE